MDKVDYTSHWKELLKALCSEELVSNDDYSLWLKNLEIKESSENTLTLYAPSQYYVNQIKQKFLELLETKSMEIFGVGIKILLEVKIPVHSEEKLVHNTSKKKPVENTPGKLPLESEFTFSSFVEGDNNSFATSAARAISQHPGEKYNPCLIYGGVGLGKTHLLQSIGNEIGLNFPDKKILYVRSNDFLFDFTEAIKNKTDVAFKNKYRKADVLLVDDIHDLQSKPQTQEELFHTFNALYDGRKQMVFTCDRPASDLKAFKDRLKSRFSRGLNVDLQPPQYETRVAILRKKREGVKCIVDDSVLDFIGQHVTTNVRDLESCLTTLTAYGELTGKKIDLETAKEKLNKSFFEQVRPNVTISNIQKKVSEYFNITPTDLKGKKRTKFIALSRQIAMYICRENTECSLTEIALEFGGRNHTTVMHSCQKIEDELKTNFTLESDIEEIKRTLREI